jgi:enoyl-CoA hydratase
VRVVIIAGAGEHFSAGRDIGSPQEKADQARRPYRRASPVATSAAGTNVARAGATSQSRPSRGCRVTALGGVILASACDLVIAADDARFCDRTVRWGGAQCGTRPAGRSGSARREYLFTGDWMTAVEAERLGFVNRVVARAARGETMALAQRIAMQDPFPAL